MLDNKWLGGGRWDDRSVISPPSGLTVSVLTSVLGLRSNNIIVVVVVVLFTVWKIMFASSFLIYIKYIQGAKHLLSSWLRVIENHKYHIFVIKIIRLRAFHWKRHWLAVFRVFINFICWHKLMFVLKPSMLNTVDACYWNSLDGSMFIVHGLAKNYLK